jgi:RNA polymerase sigma-70 factor (sigma-E family)
VIEPDVDAEFGAFVSRSSRELQRAAWLMCGNWHSAQDLVQSALLATWPHWSQIRRDDAPQVYVYRVMVTTHLRETKRRWRGEIPSAELPETNELYPQQYSEVRDALRRALAKLPAQQRTVVVLRYFVDLSEADVAAALGCSVGAVKSHAHRAVHTLRESPALAGYFHEGATI